MVVVVRMMGGIRQWPSWRQRPRLYTFRGLTPEVPTLTRSFLRQSLTPWGEQTTGGGTRRVTSAMAILNPSSPRIGMGATDEKWWQVGKKAA